MSTDSVTPNVPYSLIGKLTRRYSWSLVVALVVIAVVMLLAGVLAIVLGFPEYKEQLFEYAQYLGVVGTALGSVKAYWKEIQCKYALIRLQHASMHAVVCGLGDKGMRLVAALQAKGIQVVVVESKSDHPDIPGCWERGTVVVVGDATDKAILDEANTTHARFLFAVTGCDNTNIEIARTADGLVASSQTEGQPLFIRCFSHVATGSIRDIFSHHNLFASTHDCFDASMFSVYDAASRFVLEKYPPDVSAAAQGKTGGTLRILLIGFGMMGEALVKQAARVGHYLAWDNLEITIVDQDATAGGERFLGTFGDGGSPPVFIVPGVTVRFVQRDPAAISSLRELMGDAALQPAIVYLALEQDSPAVSLALRLRTMLGSEETPIVICMKSDLSKLMEGDEFPFTATRAIHAFNILDFACAFPVLLDEVTDEMARSIHCAYVISLIRFSETDFTSSTPLQLTGLIASEFPGWTLRGTNPLDQLNTLLLKPDLYDALTD